MVLSKNTLFDDRYFLLEMKGRGSYGEVWLAQDRQLGINVAVKVYIALDSRGVQEFKEEFVTTFGLSHPHLLHAYYYDICDDRPYLVMPYCPGSCVDFMGNIDEKTMWRFIRDVASGLEYLHQQGIVHHDIKPDNILIDEEGNFLITDFGISVKFRSTLRNNSAIGSKAKTMGGSIPYMAPEMFGEDVEAVNASDIWALGVTMYELINKDLPFFGQGGVLQRNGALIPEWQSNHSDNLKAIIKWCMSLNPWDRPMAKLLVRVAQSVLDGEILNVESIKGYEMRKAEELAQKRAAKEARRKAEEEASRKAAEEARKKAEEEARRKAEEEARRKAAEEARRKAEEEARRKAEEEARRKAEERARKEVEARRKAEEKARKEEEERRKAEEVARRKAEEKARKEEEERRKAEEVARRKAEEKARKEEEERRKAEEVARRKAEEKARKEEESRRKVEEKNKKKAETEKSETTKTSKKKWKGLVAIVGIAAILIGGGTFAYFQFFDDNSAVFEPEKDAENNLENATILLLEKEKASQGLLMLQSLADTGNPEAIFLMSRIYFDSSAAGTKGLEFYQNEWKLMRENVNLKADNFKAHALLMEAYELYGEDSHNLSVFYELGCDFLYNRGAEKDWGKARWCFEKVRESAGDNPEFKDYTEAVREKLKATASSTPVKP